MDHHSDTATAVSEEVWSDWLIDSGASRHFTGDMNDFYDFRILNTGKPLMVSTPDATIQVQGVGTVFLDHVIEDSNGKEVIVTTRLENVYYLPGVKVKLVSMGTLLQSGLLLRGDSTKIALYNNKLAQMMLFKPYPG